MDYKEINELLRQQGMYVDFGDLIKPDFFSWENGESIFNHFLTMISGAIEYQKSEFLTLLILCILFGAISQLSVVLGKKNYGNYGFYIYFICSATICIKMYWECYELVSKTIQTVLQFTQMIWPIFCASIYVADGSYTGIGTYGLLLLEAMVIEIVIFKVCVPLDKLFLSIQFANACTGQDMLSKTGELVYDGVIFILRGMLGIFCGMDIIRGLVLPSRDRLIRGGIEKVVTLIPGIGNINNLCTQVILGASETLKNGIGAGTLIILFALLAGPFVTLLLYIVCFRLLEAFMQPLVKERMNLLLGGCGKSITLLEKTLLYTYGMLFISISLITIVT